MNWQNRIYEALAKGYEVPYTPWDTTHSGNRPRLGDPGYAEWEAKRKKREEEDARRKKRKK